MTIFPDTTLQEMRNMLLRGPTHPRFHWAMGVLDATMMYPNTSNTWHNAEHIEAYNKGYEMRMKEIREREADDNDVLTHPA